MDASTRVKSIRSLTDELEQEELRMAWLTLDQFGAPAGDSILERLGKASDEDLAALAVHYGISTRGKDASLAAIIALQGQRTRSLR